MGRNFALATGGRITGTVTSSATGLPVEDVTIFVYDALGTRLQGTTDATGTYEVGNLPTGTYRAATLDANLAGFLNEIYNNLPCRPVFCQPTTIRSTGAPIAVTVAGPATVVNFVLDPGGQISGTVTNAATGAPLENLLVRIVPAGTAEWVNSRTNASGVFTARGLSPGTYYAFTRNFVGFLDQFYGGLACPVQCEIQAASISTPIVVAGTAATSGVNFSLTPGGRIGGTITDAATLAPVANVPVLFYDAQNVLAGYTVTNDSGVYISEAGLPSGTYFAIAQPGAYLSEVYENVPCGPGCSQGNIAAVGTPIVVAAGAIVTGKNFSLDLGGRVRGRVTQQGSGQPIAGAVVRIYDGLGRFATSIKSGADGVYLTLPRLVAGTYFATAGGLAAFTDEIYDDRSCGDDCLARVTSGTPIVVAPGATVTGIDFALAAVSGPPGAPVSLNAVTGTGGVLISWTQGPGTVATSYRLEAGLAPGTTIVTIPVAGNSYLAAGVRPDATTCASAASTRPARARRQRTSGSRSAPATRSRQGRRSWRPPDDRTTPRAVLARRGRRRHARGLPGGSGDRVRLVEHRHAAGGTEGLHLRSGAGRLLLPAGPRAQRRRR